ncbi:stalk domain-containing protein [Paenibacillus sp. y28]|uniref:stalk domain-containing protein n=1 Tax=Paenibacillus sp. y28 TaxID=3129110 RepID=UPI0030163198
MRKRMVILGLLLVLFAVAIVPQAGAVSSTTMTLIMTVDGTEATLNDKPLTLEAAPILVDGKVYVPAKFIGDSLDFKVAWNEKTKRVDMETPAAKLEVDIQHKSVHINTVTVPFDSVAQMVEDRLYVKLAWIADYLGAKQYYNEATKRIDVIYVKQPEGLGDADNSTPVAKFTFGKTSYRIGEPVKYIDLSYDPDAEGIAKYEWTGKQEAFFVPGTYPVSLKVTDGKGHVSKEYTRNIVITNTTYATELEYKLYHYPLNSFIETDWSMLWGNFWDLPLLTKKVTEDKSRILVLSDSPETFKEKGILYQDKIKGKGRLYADHVNGMEDNVQFVILASNLTNKEVTIHTTRKGEVYPSIYANLIGHEASVDFLLNDQQDEVLTIPPGQSRVYVQMPQFLPGQGVNVFYDVDTGDGEVMFSFMAMDRIATPTSTYFYKPLPFDGHVRGTFLVSEVRWDVDASSFDKPSRLTIGDGKDDPFTDGYDVFRKENVKNEGNYGMIYKIHAEKPRKMAILLLAKGGVFKGPFKINGEFVLAPPSGVIQPFTQIQILYRTTGKEPSLDIEFTPPAGSAFPIDVILYPLDDRE